MPDKGCFSLIAVGDIMLGGRALHVIREKGPGYPFRSTQHILKRADMTIANLEAPFTERGTPFDKTYTFRVPPGLAVGLLDAGFDVVTLANNHIMDYGPEGLYDTIHTLDSLGILHCGAGHDWNEAEKPAFFQSSGWRIGAIGYAMTYPLEFWATSERAGTAYPHQGRFEATLSKLDGIADLVVVSFHWGGELRPQPKSYQRSYARRAIDLGADIVIGHHPHILQGVEIYKDRLIVFSLGNFSFGSYSQNARSSIIIKVRFDEQGFLMAQVIPVSVLNTEVEFQPAPLMDGERARVIDELNTLSRDLNGGRDIVRSSGLILPY